MTSAPIPINDAERVAALRSYGVLDTPPEPDYDELTRLAAQICHVPIALISLVEEDRQWFKAKIGLAATETPRETSFCAHVVAAPAAGVLVVPDALLDPRFSDNPLVLDGPQIRFYAGAPLVTHDGWTLGTLCVIDQRPREITPDQLHALEILRRHVVNTLELRRLVGRQNAVIVDLEETRRALDQARQVAEASTRAKAEFLATMSHEIRTPMNAVIGMTTLLRASPLTAEQRETVDTIQTSGEHLLTVINDVLDFSKIESGRVELESVPFRVADCVKSAVNLVASQASAKNLALRTDLSPDIPDWVAGDATRLRQILVNLLANAAKFTAAGEIRVRVHFRSLAAGRGELTFEVIDTGIGMTPEQISRMFQPYSQADTSTTRLFGGTGLGLAISRKLAELHGGRMWVESEVGRGSSFIFTAAVGPAVPPAAQPSALDGEFDPDFARRHPWRILIAEDNVVNQKVIVRTLRKLGYAPEVVGDGRAALAALRHGDFNLVLMDVEMPELDGLAATRVLRAEFPAALQPVVVAMTAHGLADHQDAFRAAGMDAYLGKPLRVSELTSLLATVQSEHRHPAS